MSRPLAHYGSSGSGLRCSHGSTLDERIPRPKQPKTALPPSLRKSLGFQPRREEDAATSSTLYKAGAGVLKSVGSAPDGSYLRGGSGVPASVRCSAMARQRQGQTRAVVFRPTLEDGGTVSANYGASRTSTRVRAPPRGSAAAAAVDRKPLPKKRPPAVPALALPPQDRAVHTQAFH